MVVTKERGRTYFTVRGTRDGGLRGADHDRRGEFVGIQFELGAFMPSLPLTHLVDAALTLPESGGGSFWQAARRGSSPTSRTLMRSSVAWCARACWSATRSSSPPRGVGAKELS